VGFDCKVLSDSNVLHSVGPAMTFCPSMETEYLSLIFIASFINGLPNKFMPLTAKELIQKDILKVYSGLKQYIPGKPTKRG